jgi:beta-lactamase regulating signal transducer with metallopeptidase domain
MTWSGVDMFAQVIVERVINSLPEGLLIALGAWLLLRLMSRQNSGTRFAVWLIALIGVLALPFLGGVSRAEHYFPGLHSHSEFTIPSFWAWAFLSVWIPVAAAALARLIAGLWQIGQIRRVCAEIDPASLDPRLRQLFEQTKQPVRLLVSDKVRVPAALGFTKPAIVLPAWTLHEFTAAELQPILIHELAHLRRYDGWTNLLQKAARALFFFHPAVWWIDARLSLEREMACDDAVLNVTGNPRGYAGSLISLLERGVERRGWAMAQAAVARARDASHRIARILRVATSATAGSATTGITGHALGLAAALSIVCAGMVLYAPRLLAFDPVGLASVARLHSQPLTDNPIAPRATAIAAAFHPDQMPVLMHKADISRTVHSRRPAVRSVALHKARFGSTSVVMASFVTHASSVTHASFVTHIGAEQPDFTPVILVIDASQLQNGQWPAASIQTIRFVTHDPAGLRVEIVRIMITTSNPAGTGSGQASRI